MKLVSPIGEATRYSGRLGLDGPQADFRKPMTLNEVPDPIRGSS